MLSQERFNELFEIYKSFDWPPIDSSSEGWKPLEQSAMNEWLRQSESIRNEDPRSTELAVEYFRIYIATGKIDYFMFVHFYGPRH